MTKRQFTEQEIQIARYQRLSREVTDPLAACCYRSLSKNLKPTCEGIATSIKAVLNVGRTQLKVMFQTRGADPHPDLF